MEHPLTCPLCSHPGFANVDSLRLALISATSRRLVCPVCQDILQGLDKLTIHLVSHSLHDHLLRASFASSISTSPLALTQNNIQDLQAEASQHSLNICNDTNQSQLNIPFLIGAGGMHGCLAQMEVSNMSSSAETLTNSASYILINLPPPQTIKGGINTNTSDIAPTENVHIMTSAVCPEKEVTSYETDNFTEAREILSKPVLIAPQKTNQNDPETEEVTNSVSHNPIPPSGILFVQQSVIGNRTSQTNIEKQTERLGQETQRAGLLSSEGTSVEEANAFLVPSECEDVHMSEEFHSLQERSNNSEVLLSCKVCGIHFKDSRISMLHYQLVHDKNAEEIGVIQSEAPHPSQKRYSWNSRQKTNCFDGTERDNTCSPHRFPCHMCPKVFRMRGSLMVHLRVAHTSASIGRIVDGSSAGNSGATAMVQSLKDCQPLDTFTIPSREYSYNVHRAISSFQNPEESSVSCAGASGPSSSVSALSQASSVMSSASRTNSAIECSSLSTLASEPAPCSSFATGCSDKTLSNIVMASHHVDTLIPHNSSAPSLQESPSPPSPPITSSPATGNDSSNTSMGSNFICTVCNKTFSQESVLAQHVKAHEGKQWECDVCTKLFTTKYFLKKHKRLHTGEMPYTCATCNKSFTFQQSYHKHLLYHSDEKPHTCAECGRSFKELSTLHNHQRIHTGEKPWACETCEWFVFVLALTALIGPLVLAFVCVLWHDNSCVSEQIPVFQMQKIGTVLT